MKREVKIQNPRDRECGGFLRPYKRRYGNSNVKCYNCQRFGQYASECKNVIDIVEKKANYIEEEKKRRQRI